MKLVDAQQQLAVLRDILATAVAPVEASELERLLQIANRQQAGWGRFGVEGHWIIGRYLLRFQQAPRGRPKKCKLHI